VAGLRPKRADQNVVFRSGELAPRQPASPPARELTGKFRARCKQSACGARFLFLLYEVFLSYGIFTLIAATQNGQRALSVTRLS
jgi:hypothetical protein